MEDNSRIYMYVSVKWSIIGSENGLPSIWHQAIIWTKVDVLLIVPFETDFSESWFSFQENVDENVVCECVVNAAIIKLEQLERLRSEDTPAASWLPIPLNHIGSQVKRRQSQSYKFKKFAKVSNFGIRWVLLKIQSGHDSVHRRTDGQTDKVIPVYPPFNFVEAGGITSSCYHETNIFIRLHEETDATMK